MRTKYGLPNAFKTSLNFDLEKLRSQVIDLQDKFIDVFEQDPRLYSNTEKLANSVHDQFKQVNLTVYNDTPDLTEKQLADEEQYVSSLSKSQQLKRRKNPIDPRLNEYNYNKPTEIYTGSYFEEVANSFKSNPIRVRLAKLTAHTMLDPHIDYDPTYSTRILIPIFSNSDAYTIIWRRNKPTMYQFNPDGHAYFINTGLKHAVINMGDNDRVNLMISLDGQLDLEEIPIDLESIDERRIKV